jgi:hypothetical protein
MGQLVYVDGFDAGDWASRYSLTDGTETGMGTSTNTRTGEGFSWINGTSSTINAGLFRPIPSAAVTVIGIAIRTNGVPFSSSYNNRLLAVGNASGVQIGYTLRNSGTHGLYRGADTTLLATVPAPVGSWYYFEMKVYPHDTEGFVEARVNGQVVASFTGDTQNVGTLGTLDRLYIGSATGGNGDAGNTRFDDVYVVTGTSVADAQYLGEIRVKSLKVNGPGTYTGFTPTGSATNWENVDEFPPSDVDFNASDVTGTKDTYTTENLALTPGDKIIGVQANAVVSTVEAGTAAAKLVFRSGTNETVSAAQNVTSTAATVSAIFQNDPATGSAWTESGVNDTEVGIEVG